VHEAIGQRQESDIPSGAVSQEVQKGYMLYDRLVRPAKVIVATGE
jgi:molecular chaperone GrpE